MMCLIFFRGILGSILSSQAASPTLKNPDFASAGTRFLKKQYFRSNDGFGNVLGLSWAPLGGSWGSLGGSLGPLDRPKGASSFVLELPWASFARFLLPKMVVRAFWGRLWLVFDASGGFGGGVLVSVKSILTTKTHSGSFFVTSAS